MHAMAGPCGSPDPPPGGRQCRQARRASRIVGDYRLLDNCHGCAETRREQHDVRHRVAGDANARWTCTSVERSETDVAVADRDPVRDHPPMGPRGPRSLAPV